MNREGKLYLFVKDIIDRNLHRSLKYSAAGFIGFLLVEFFTYLFFHFYHLHNLLAVTPSFLIGVAAEFLINEHWTTRGEGTHSGNIPGLVIRLFKFEITNLAGTLLAVVIQYILYITFGLTPLIGNIIGSAFSFPVNYYIQMKVTWGIKLSS